MKFLKFNSPIVLLVGAYAAGMAIVSIGCMEEADSVSQESTGLRIEGSKDSVEDVEPAFASVNPE